MIMAISLEFGLSAELQRFQIETCHSKSNPKLTCWVVVVRNQHDQITTSRVPFAGLVAELRLELVQRLVELVLRDQVASVVTQLRCRSKRIGRGGTMKMKIKTKISNRRR